MVTNNYITNLLKCCFKQIKTFLRFHNLGHNVVLFKTILQSVPFSYAMKTPQNGWNNCTESSLNVSCENNHNLCSAVSTTQESTRLANTCLVRSAFYDTRSFHTAPWAPYLKRCAQLLSQLPLPSLAVLYSLSLLLLSLISSLLWKTKDAYQTKWVITIVWRGQSCLKRLTTVSSSLVIYMP